MASITNKHLSLVL